MSTACAQWHQHTEVRRAISTKNGEVFLNVGQTGQKFYRGGRRGRGGKGAVDAARRTGGSVGAPNCQLKRVATDRFTRRVYLRELLLTDPLVVAPLVIQGQVE